MSKNNIRDLEYAKIQNTSHFAYYIKPDPLPIAVKWLNIMKGIQ